MISNLKKISSSTIIPLILILTLLSIGILIPILSIVIFGTILGYYVRWISKKIRPYVKYDTLAVFLGIIILSIPVILLLYFTFIEFLSIVGSLSGPLQQAATGNSTMNIPQINEAVQNLNLPANFSQTFAETIKSGITQFISYIANLTIGLVSSIPALAAQLLILIFSVFYFARDGDKVIQYIKDVIPDRDNNFYLQIFSSADDVLKSIIVGNVIPAAILGILSGILYFFLGYPYAILLAIISGIAMFIPVIGPWIIYGAIGVFSILIGNTFQGVMVILFGWIIETTTDFYIRPRISVQYSEVHPLVFLLGFIYGAVTMGVPGLFIGPLILGITYAAYKIYRNEKIKNTT
ncbi:AI-2E family transporter [Methanobacterium sp. ACI-7]|uniref:AI-2E family transporter n=1 Tax=unclassified Methanobacterium TaxID=2627676 RepID=UPI0039C27DF7